MNRRDLLKLLLAVPTATLFPKPKLPKSVGTWEFKTPVTHPEAHHWILIGADWHKTIWLDLRPRE